MASFASFAPVFEKDTPVLRLNFGKDPSVRWVLWPVFAWRVVAPVPKERKLNVFQRAVLGLARAGVVCTGDVADRLLIAPDLVALVVQELVEQLGLLDYWGKPTKRGLEWLEDFEQEPADEARVGHVLSDAFTGTLWARFLTGDLPIADVEMNDDGWPVLLSGSAGDPWKDRTFSVLPGARDAIVMARPDVKDVLRVARLHRRQRQRDFEELIDDARDVPRLQRVSFIDDRPQPYLFALRVRRHDSGDWMVEDPFGHGESIELRTRMEERLDSNKGLRPWLAPLIGSDPDTPTLAHLQTEAAWKVEERLTVSIRQHEVVQQQLVAMQRALLEAESHDAPADKWNDVLVKADGAVLWALRVMHRPYAEASPPFCADFDRMPVPSRNPIAEAAGAVGLLGDVPKRILSITRSQVKDAEKGRGSLRSALVLALLAARWNQDHPLRRALAIHPDLLFRIDELASDRNPAAHGGAHTSPPIVHRHIATAYDAVEAFLLAN
jgi:hypothetical protein